MGNLLPLQLLLVTGIIIINVVPSYPVVTICVKENSTNFGYFDLSLACNSTLTTLLKALEYSHTLQNLYLDEPVTILLAEGLHELQDTPYAKFDNVSDFSIIGSSEGVTMIACTPAGSTGLTFTASRGISLHRISFTQCGQRHLSTSSNFQTQNFSYIDFQSSLYFEQCRDVSLSSIAVTHSFGIAAQFYATTGMNLIYDSTFASNNNSVPNGGGLAIEFPYCFPGDISCNDSESSIPLDAISNANFNISGCRFETNTAINSDPSNSSYAYPYHTSHNAFGRGGGLSIFFKGHAFNNSIIVSQSCFKGNTASFGGGLFIQFEDASAKNYVSIEECLFISNTAYQNGGASVVNFLQFDAQRMQNNTVQFVDIFFNNNKASYGGGLSFYATREVNQIQPTNVFLILRANFTSNRAQFGSAVDLSFWHLIHNGAEIEPVFDDCSFTSNVVECQQGKVVGSGTMYLDAVPVTFRRHISFESNIGTGIVASSTEVTFANGCLALFNNNTGTYGGAISLLEHSTMIVGENTSFTFSHNIARNKGGALHASFVGKHDSIASRNCFLQYTDPSLDPAYWQTSFTFEGNVQADKKPNAIYATTILSCLWGKYSGTTEVSQLKANVFCWKYSNNIWKYRPSSLCHDNIITDPANFGVSMQMFNVSLIPGQLTFLALYAYDELGNNVTDDLVFSLSSFNINSTVRVDDNYRIVSNNIIRLLQENEAVGHGLVLLESDSTRSIETFLNVTFELCPYGFMLVNGSCDNCAGNFKGYVECSSGFHLKVQQGYWIGPSPKDNTAVVGLCRYCNTVVNEDASFVLVPAHALSQDPTIDIQCQENRMGTLCSQCIANYSPAVDTMTFECVECPGIDIVGVLYVTLDFVFTTILYLVLLFTNFKLTSGPFNAIILFAQMLTTALGDLNTFTANIVRSESWAVVLNSIYELPYGIWNLQFWIPEIHPHCIAPGMSNADVLALHYITALYPFILVLLSVILVKVNDRYGIYQKLKKQIKIRPLHYCLDQFELRMAEQFADKNKDWVTVANKRIRNVFASAVLLTYTKISLVTCYLLAPTPLWHATDNNPHMYVLYIDGQFSPSELQYLVPALFFTILIVLFPLFLILFAYASEEQSKAHPQYINHLLRAYQEEFKHSSINIDNHRCKKYWNIKFRDCKTLHKDFSWMSGVYFYFRLLMLLVFSLSWNFAIQSSIQTIFCIVMAMIVVVVQPYEKNWINKLDSCVFLLMAIITSLSVYQYYNIISDTGYSEWTFVIQYVLILLPLVYLAVYAFVVKCYKRGCQKKHVNGINRDVYVNPINDGEMELAAEYHPFEQRKRRTMSNNV